ncbi:Os01g0611950, partial [Oryza sativa Japonica Group]
DRVVVHPFLEASAHHHVEHPRVQGAPLPPHLGEQREGVRGRRAPRRDGEEVGAGLGVRGDPARLHAGVGGGGRASAAGAAQGGEEAAEERGGLP